MLKYETPLEYKLIIDSTKEVTFIEPEADIIEVIALVSSDEKQQIWYLLNSELQYCYPYIFQTIQNWILLSLD